MKDLGNIADSDFDGIADLAEDINLDGNLDNDDSDGDGTANYLDDDDDGDGLKTSIEDADKDGDPRNDDTDSDGIPDYLDVSCGECPSSVTDLEGKTYKVVQQGEQCWMAENLKVMPYFNASRANSTTTQPTMFTMGE